ncbi:MAG: aminotransferase class IV, partial [Thermoplasmata archaeon]|nr:aminotransferase class IV [Thermoplasmata archaeon]
MKEEVSLKTYIDGEFVDEKDAKISIFDHGLLYGDGIFEGIRAYNKRIFKLEEHVDRLYESAKAIKLVVPIGRDELVEAILETCRI